MVRRRPAAARHVGGAVVWTREPPEGAPWRRGRNWAAAWWTCAPTAALWVSLRPSLATCGGCRAGGPAGIGRASERGVDARRDSTRGDGFCASVRRSRLGVDQQGHLDLRRVLRGAPDAGPAHQLRQTAAQGYLGALPADYGIPPSPSGLRRGRPSPRLPGSQCFSFRQVHALHSNGANSIWEHSLLDPAQRAQQAAGGAGGGGGGGGVGGGGRRKPQAKEPVKPVKSDFIRTKHQLLGFVHRDSEGDPSR